MKIVIFPNLKKKDAYSCTLDVCDILGKLGAEISMDDKYRETFSLLENIKYGEFRKLAEEADFAVAIGGDGTILKCASAMTGTDTKLLGINTGRLGFMASVEKDNLKANNFLTELWTLLADLRLWRRMNIPDVICLALCSFAIAYNNSF